MYQLVNDLIDLSQQLGFAFYHGKSVLLAVVADAFYLNQFAVHFIQNEANGQVIADDAIQFAVFHILTGQLHGIITVYLCAFNLACNLQISGGAGLYTDLLTFQAILIGNGSVARFYNHDLLGGEILIGEIHLLQTLVVFGIARTDDVDLAALERSRQGIKFHILYHELYAQFICDRFCNICVHAYHIAAAVLAFKRRELCIRSPDQLALFFNFIQGRFAASATTHSQYSGHCNAYQQGQYFLTMLHVLFLPSRMTYQMDVL